MIRRPYPDHAYSEAPRARCHWPRPPEGAALDRDLAVDVAVIGAGVTGLNAALPLARKGRSVAVLDRSVAFGASGRNGGFCCLGGAKASDARLARRHGEAGRLDWRRTEKDAVAHVEALIGELSLDVDRHSEGETMLAHSPRAWREMQASADGLARDYGVTPELTPPEQMAQAGMAGPFHGALTLPIGFGLNPGKYLAGLAQAVRDAGGAVHAGADVQAMARAGDGYRLQAGDRQVTARQVIVATNGYGSDSLIPWLAGRFMPAQSAVLVTRPLTEAEAAEQGWTSRQMAYTSRDFLHYFRRMPDGRMLFGMRGALGSSPAADARAEARLRRQFASMFPVFAKAEAPQVWSGFVALSTSLAPYAGPVPGMPGVFAAFNYHGNGVAMGSYCGALLADLALSGRTGRRYPDVLKSVPARFPGGRWRRHLLRPAYALAMATDW